MDRPADVLPERAWIALAALSVAAAAAINIWRIQFGVDFTDESFYATLATAIARGGRALIDEWNLAQFAAYPLVPIVKITGTTGVILTLRIVNVVMRIGTAVMVAWALRPYMRAPFAIMASLLTFACVPFDIASVSYNTLGSLALTAGCFAAIGTSRRLVIPSVVEGPGGAGGAPHSHPGPSTTLGMTDISAGALHAIACWAYPPLAVAALTSLILGAFRDRRFAVRYLIGGAIGSLPWIAVVLHAGVDAFMRVLRFGSAVAVPRTLPERIELAAQLFASHPPLILLAAAIATIVALTKWRAAALQLALPLVVLTAFLERFPVLYSTMGFPSWLALFGGLASIFLWREERFRPLIVHAIVPGLVAGATYAICSSNGAINFGVGALPAAQATVAMFVMLCTRPVVAFVITSLCWFLPSAVQYRPTAVYRDDDVWRLTARIAHGPFAGLRTTPGKLAWVNQLQADVAQTERPGDHIFFFYNFPAGYLMSSSHPASPSSWTMNKPHAREADQLPGLFAQRAWPDVVVRLRRIPLNRTVDLHFDYPPGDALNAAFRNYRVAIVRADYEVLVRTP